ncbi:MAG: uroporphyrinogen-III synthase [Gammaproteobacteria bacterium]
MTATSARSRVWVTRPMHQADGICRLLEDAGLDVVRFPVIEIEAIADCSRLSQLFARIATYRYLIFVSQNAVALSYQHYLDKTSLPPGIVVIAIGNSTAAALHQHGVQDVIHAGSSADSEALLAMPELQSSAITGSDILLIRGQGGRDLLVNALNQRGANVEIAEVYMRKPPQYDTNELDWLWQQEAPDAIIVTSNEGIKHLLGLTPVGHREKLLHTPLIVMSERNADFAREHGFDAGIVVTNEQNDTGLYRATIELLETGHT